MSTPPFTLKPLVSEIRYICHYWKEFGDYGTTL